MSSEVCCYYNPYFKDGCSKGKDCEFKHLSLEKYTSFVESSTQDKSAAYYGFKSAMKKFNEHRYFMSSSILKSLQHDSPHTPRYNLWCARTMEKLNCLESAEVYYRRAIATQPHNATFHGRYASLLHFKLNRLEEAKSHYEIALDLRDDINAVHCHYGKLLCDLGDANERAKYHFNKCLDLFANDEECHFYLGQLLYKSGDLLTAQYHIKRALYLQNKPYVWHYYYFALICIELEKYREAKQHLQICLDLQQAMKSNIWDKIYVEYGLLLVFVFNSLDTGLKYVTEYVNTRMQPEVEREFIMDASSNSPITLETYNKWRNMLTNKDINTAASSKQDTQSISPVSPSSEVEIETESPSSQFEIESESAISFFLSNEFEIKQPSEEDSESRFELDEVLQSVPCSVQNAFYRYLQNIGLCSYYSKFEEAKINDIRLIEHIDSSFLLKNIGMNSAEVLIWMNYMKDEWKKECHRLSRQWKKQDRFLYTLFYDVFAMNGIMTLATFHSYFKKPKDICYLVENNMEHAQSIWNLFQNIS
eukprot:236402_1